MSEQTKKEYGPIWQLEENAKGKRLVAAGNRAEADKLIKKAIALEVEAGEYEEAARVLKGSSMKTG